MQKCQYKETVPEQDAVVKRDNFTKQLEQLFALELANIKMRGQKLIYIDIVKISLTELQLILSPIAMNEVDETNDMCQSIYAQVAIDGDVGLVGF